MIAKTAGLVALLIALTLVWGGFAPTALAQSDPLANCRYYTKTQQDFEQGLSHCQEAIAKYPEDPEAHFYGGWCLAETGNWNDAWASFQWLIDRKDSDDKNTRKLAGKAEKQALYYYSNHFNRGVELLKEPNNEEARNEFLIATQIYPMKIDAHLNLGYTQAQLDDLDAAMESFQKAIEMDPENSAGRLYYWDALNLKLKSLRAAETRDPEMITQVTGKLKDTLQKVLESDTKPADRATAHLQLADLSFADGDNETALEHVKKAIEIAPEKIPELYNIGIEFYNNDEYGPTIEAMKTVISQLDDPNDEVWRKAVYVMGLSCMYSQDFEGCIQAFDQLVEIDPENMDYYIKRGTAHAKLGHKDEASRDILKWEEMKEQQVTGETE